MVRRLAGAMGEYRAGCSKSSSTANPGAQRRARAAGRLPSGVTLQDLNEARTPLADFFSILQ